MIFSPLILMYHGIKTDSQSIPGGRETGAELYDVLLAQFTQQMFWLKQHGYRSIAVDEFDPTSATKQVVLTFDDGELNNYVHALPVLKQLDFKAYFFIITDRIGQPGYMGWDELRQLDEAGMMIGSHSASHSILTHLSLPQIQAELQNSRHCLVSFLGDRVKTFSIPRGFCNDQVIQLAYETGYQEVFISERPATLQNRCWERLSVKAAWDLQRFERAIAGQKNIKEKLFDHLKKTAKRVLKGNLYNQMRSTIIHFTHSQ